MDCNAPFVQPGEFVFLLLVPFAAALEVVLEAKTAADGATPG